MTMYAVGDVQGCLDPLLGLLEQVSFDPSQDQLISVGDLVNRGPKSLETMRFCKGLGSAFKMVLGNHDLHLLAIAHGVRDPTIKDTLDDILRAPDKGDLLNWLQHQPLLLEASGYHFVHAGIPPIWSLELAHQLAAEVSGALQSEQSGAYFESMYGNLPAIWSDSLEGPERWRVITNYLCRMRLCTAEGELELESRNAVESAESAEAAAPFLPWFTHTNRQSADQKIVFGHWAALEGRDCGENVFALDTGCVWGGPMRLMNLETQEYFHQPA